MPMPSLISRLQRLEAIGQRENELAPERCRFIGRAALQHLSTEHLRWLSEAKKTGLEGRPLTSQDLAAAEALQTAIGAECRKAGITLAEFNRYRAAATPAS
jgi:hypothetical protein